MKRTFKIHFPVRWALLIAACAGMLFGQSNTGLQSDARKAQAEIAKLNAETEKLKAEEAYYRHGQWFNLAQNMIGFAAIAIPVVIAVKQLGAQRKAQQERSQTDTELLRQRARVDASLKAAEIAMNVPNTSQMKSRAEVLSRLLHEIVPDFGKSLKDLDYSKVGFFSWHSRFSSLLEAIASQPHEAFLIVKTYDTLFPGDDVNSKGRISALIKQLQTNKA